MRAFNMAFPATLLAAFSAAAAPIDEIRAGILAQGFGVMSPDKEDGVGINGEILFNRIYTLRPIGAPRPHVGFSIATGDFATSQVYAGLTWEQNIGSRLFVDAGLGIAVHDGETEFSSPDPLLGERNYLGCRALFRLSADLGYRLTERASMSLHAEHLSNAGLCSENEGLDNAGVRLGYKL